MGARTRRRAVPAGGPDPVTDARSGWGSPADRPPRPRHVLATSSTRPRLGVGDPRTEPDDLGAIQSVYGAIADLYLTGREGEREVPATSRPCRRRGGGPSVARSALISPQKSFLRSSGDRFVPHLTRTTAVNAGALEGRIVHPVGHPPAVLGGQTAVNTTIRAVPGPSGGNRAARALSPQEGRPGPEQPRAAPSIVPGPWLRARAGCSSHARDTTSPRARECHGTRWHLHRSLRYCHRLPATHGGNNTEVPRPRARCGGGRLMSAGWRSPVEYGDVRTRGPRTGSTAACGRGFLIGDTLPAQTLRSAPARHAG